MSDRNSDCDSGSHSTAKRSLPSWMSSTENRKKSPKKQNCAGNKTLGNNDEDKTASLCDATQNGSDFSKLLEGVIFVLSGFVNPVRGTLRAQALEMGAEYQPDWNSGCTLLICAFPNTPKFRQVETDCGTIVSKEWISECYNHKKLVGIERYLMCAGKPWRRYTEQNRTNKVKESALSEGPTKSALSEMPIKRAVTRSVVSVDSESSKGGFSRCTDNLLLPARVHEWAAVDLSQAISWLEGQDEKPEAAEIRSIAAKGILTCLQDAVDSLRKNEDINTVTEKWMFVPRVVTCLAETEGRTHEGLLSKDELYELAVSCQKKYQDELKLLNSSTENEKYKIEDYIKRNVEPDEEGFDSDQTIEMTEEEIYFACKQSGC